MHGNCTSGGLAVKYAPRALSQVVGQPQAVGSLVAFLKNPHSGAFIFHGPTGVGKTATAKAMALELGCSDEFEECGGITEIPSGKQDGRSVEDLMRKLRVRPMLGSGWKVAIINEADSMTPQAEAIWLDALESLPPKSIVVFTTNELRRMTRRLIGRCETVAFDGESKAFLDGMHSLVRRVWKNETGQALKSIPKNLGRYEMAAGASSIRLALQQISPMIRLKSIQDEVAVPFIRDEAAIQEERWQAAAKKAVATRRARKAVANV